ncbi:MAG: GNAT family N-acetyltransferase [Gaiellales bacterium]
MTIRDRIVGELAALAPLRVEQAPDWARWLNDPDTTRYLYGRRERPPGHVSLEEMVDWGRRMLADPWRMAVAIESAADGTVVGNARLVPMLRGRARYSIVIGEADHRGRGLGTEATRLMCRLGFSHMGVREIVLDVDPRNLPAVAAYRRAGFVHGRGDSMHLGVAQRAMSGVPVGPGR